MEKKIFRYISKEGGKAEFRFTNGKCDGFFVDNKREYDDKYKGKFLDDDFIKGLKVSGFKKTKSLQLLFNKHKIMKVYLVSHEGNPSIIKIEAWSRINRVGDNGIYVESVNAFLRKKDAKKWLEERGWNHLEIKTFEYKN